MHCHASCCVQQTQGTLGGDRQSQIHLPAGGLPVSVNEVHTTAESLTDKAVDAELRHLRTCFSEVAWVLVTSICKLVHGYHYCLYYRHTKADRQRYTHQGRQTAHTKADRQQHTLRQIAHSSSDTPNKPTAFLV